MTVAATKLSARSHVWATALTLAGQPDLRRSLVAELAAYLNQPEAPVEARCRTAAAELAAAWQTSAPAQPAAINAFYQRADTYLYDLTWWHALGHDNSVLAQVEALELALTHHARTALDFGSGIGSLGLLLAQHGLHVTLADLNPQLNAYARWRFAQRGLAANILDLPPGALELPTQAFDFISAVDVLEHLPNPVATLTALAAALRPGGTLYIHLPGAPDLDHPMHLWHQPAVLLRHLGRTGLWLEGANTRLGQQGDSSTLVLRRGIGPRYELNVGLELRPDAAGGVLLSRHPLVALRLNPPAFGLLANLKGAATALELVAGQRTLALNAATNFLDSLAQRRLLLRHMPTPDVWPSVSIIVPAHGRPAATRACVESLLALHYPGEPPEILVVDDASEPPLAPALAGLPVRTLHLAVNSGQSVARNHAAAVAKGDVLAFIDNDCVAAPDWLTMLVAALDEPGVELAGGRVVAPPPTGPVAAFEAVRSPLDMGAVSGAVGPDEPLSYMPSCNLVVRRGLLLRLGGFDPAMQLGEDVDLIWRALQAGAQARYVAASTVVHHHRVQLGALLRRRADYASSEADLQRRHPTGQRTLVLPQVTLLLLAALVSAKKAWPLSLVCGATALGRLGVEIGAKRRDLSKNGVTLPTQDVGGAVLQAHRAALYHLGANVTRYYSLPLLAAGLRWPASLPALAILLLTPPIIDYHRLQPRLALPTFIGLYWLELTAYQLGVWSGCWQRRTFRPLWPKLRWGR